MSVPIKVVRSPEKFTQVSGRGAVSQQSVNMNYKMPSIDCQLPALLHTLTAATTRPFLLEL